MSETKDRKPAAPPKKPLSRPSGAEQRERSWADRGGDDSREAPVRQTYRDGGEINECWNHRNY